MFRHWSFGILFYGKCHDNFLKYYTMTFSWYIWHIIPFFSKPLTYSLTHYDKTFHIISWQTLLWLLHDIFDIRWLIVFFHIQFLGNVYSTVLCLIIITACVCSPCNVRVCLKEFPSLEVDLDLDSHDPIIVSSPSHAAYVPISLVSLWGGI